MTENSLPELKENYSLKPYNTLGIDAKAEKFFLVESEAHLNLILSDPRYRKTRKLVLGGGSNILFAGDFEGLILHIAIKGIEKIDEDEGHVWIKIGAGENWHKFVRHCVEKGWGGVENLSLIPGTVGAAPIQNIGAYGVELREVFSSLEAVDIGTGEKRTFSKEECRFDYRDSIFKNELKDKYLITRVVLRLSKEPEVNTSYGSIRQKLDEKEIEDPTIRDLSDIVIEIRQSKLPDPAEVGNAGSFFKNPVVSTEKFKQLKKEYPDIPAYPLDSGGVKVPAGWLIEEAGWKGRVIGNAGTYRQQALVIVNHGGATGVEILDLARKIQSDVEERFSIELVPEVNIID